MAFSAQTPGRVGMYMPVYVYTYSICAFSPPGLAVLHSAHAKTFSTFFPQPEVGKKSRLLLLKAGLVGWLHGVSAAELLPAGALSWCRRHWGDTVLPEHPLALPHV